MPWDRDEDLKEEVDQKEGLKRGLRMGRLMVIMPTMVSRTPLGHVSKSSGRLLMKRHTID